MLKSNGRGVQRGRDNLRNRLLQRDGCYRASQEIFVTVRQNMAPNTRSGTGGVPEGHPPHEHVEPEEILAPGSAEDDPMEDAQDAQGREAQDVELALSIHDLIEESIFERDDENDMETGAEPDTLVGDRRPVQPTVAPPATVAPAPVVNARVPSGLARINALNARYEKLKAEKALAQLERNVAELEAERLDGYAPKPSQAGTNTLDKDALALERATEIRAPKIYMGESQQELNNWVEDVESTFRSRPLIYGSEKQKCLYAGKYTGGQPKAEWSAMDTRIRANPEASYYWKDMVDMFQQKLLPTHLRQVKVTMEIKELHQLANQRVGELITHLESLEKQRMTQPSDEVRREHLLGAVHPYLREDLISKDRLGTTRLELEENLQSIEGVIPTPSGISVRRSIGPARTPTGTSNNPGRRGQPYNKLQGRTPTGGDSYRPQANATSRPAREEITCFNCGGKGHRQAVCKKPRKEGTPSGNATGQ